MKLREVLRVLTAAVGPVLLSGLWRSQSQHPLRTLCRMKGWR
jgi:hypothetical protein